MNSETKKRNIEFIGFNILLVLIVLAASLSSYLFPCVEKRIDYNAVGIVCQVITALVCCIASMIGISFSIQDSTIFGIKIKVLRELRTEKKYSLQEIMVISVIIVALNLLLYICKFVFASFGLSISAVLFCLFIIRKEVPLMAKKEDAGLSILKSRVLDDTNAAGVYATDFDNALKYLICNKNLKTTYEKLRFDADNVENNQMLLVKLLDLQVDIANQLKTIESKKVLTETANSLQENLTDIVTFSFDITEILGNEHGKYAHYVSNAILGLNSDRLGREECASVINQSLHTLDYLRNNGQDERKKDFLYSILVSLFTYSVSRADFSILNAVQKYYSARTYILKKDYSSTLLFSLYSLYLFYLCELETMVPIEIKEKLHDTVCAERNEVIDGRLIYSWMNLFREFSEKADVDYTEFMRVFNNNEFSLEYLLLNAGLHSIVMDQELAFQWFMANLLNREGVIIDDFSEVFGEIVENETTYRLKRLYDVCYKNEKTFHAPEIMTKMLSFYGVDKNAFSLFLIVEKNNHSLFNYLTEIKAKSIINEALRMNELDERELEEKIKTGVIIALNKEWGKDKSLKVDSEKKYLRIAIEKVDAINFDEALIDHFVWSTICSLRKELMPKKIVRDDGFDSEIRNLISETIAAASLSCKHSVPLFISNSELQKQFSDKLSSVHEFQSSILPHTSLILRGGFSFNFVVDDVKIERPTEEKLNEMVESYKRADGQYVYEGTFLSREDVHNVVRSKAIIITYSVRYVIEAPEGEIIEIVLFPEHTHKE